MSLLDTNYLKLRRLKKYFYLNIMILMLTISVINSNSLLKLSNRENSISDEISFTKSHISIKNLYEDALFSWEKLQLRKDIYGKTKTGLYFSQEIETQKNMTSVIGGEVLGILYALYKISGNRSYLDLAWSYWNKILTYCLKQIVVKNETYYVLSNYDWLKDEKVGSDLYLFNTYQPIIFEDKRFLKAFEETFVSSYKLFFANTSLLIESIDEFGDVRSSVHHITWTGVHRKLTQLIWLYYFTKNTTYKSWIDASIEAIWDSRSSETDLLPRRLDALNGIVTDSTISHYDMACWLNVLQLLYIVNDYDMEAGTGSNTYFDLMNETSKAIVKHFWLSSDNRWVYRCSYETGNYAMRLAEMNAFYVDSALIRSYELTGVQDYLD